MKILDKVKILRKPTKTISGVTPVAVMLPPRKCKHGVCLYCPSLNAPQSYTPESPAVLRAKKLEYDPYEQTKTRIKSYELMGHPNDKIELIIMGGTFLSFPKKFQYEFVKACYNAMNGKESKTLEEAKKLNEKAKHRCVALCIETRPDICGEKEIKRMLEFGATRVELGVQCIDDKIYKKINRGHTVQDVVDSTERLKKAGFKVGYHLMPGLPGSNPKKDLEMFKNIFSDERFRPDQVKIYPCQVLKGAKLEKDYFAGKFRPYTEKETIELIIKLMKIVPEYCRVMRVMREIPPAFLISGLKKIDLRKDIEERIRAEKTKINEIRFREIGFALRDNRKIDYKTKIKKIEYDASRGKEIFLEIVNKDNLLFGLLRLRLDGNEAMIRELHVYGPSVIIGNHEQEKFQHKGFGKQLMDEAERIAKNKKASKIRVISGIGVREYYKKIGYKLDKEGYMEKELEMPQSYKSVITYKLQHTKRFINSF
jgi:elongator complex protein 3